MSGPPTKRVGDPLEETQNLASDRLVVTTRGFGETCTVQPKTNKQEIRL